MLMEIINFIFEENSVFFIHVLNVFILIMLIVLFIFARHGRQSDSYED